MKTVFFLVCMLMMSTAMQARDDDAINQFFGYQRSAVREKLYLHLDKPYYAAGDTIWFRGTLLNADTHSYLVKSNFIYVELLSESDSVVSRRKVKRDGLCYHNYIDIATEIPEGDYSLRAYTNWMRNFGTEYFYSRRIHIGNTLKKRTFTETIQRDYHVTFFPEGGELLAEVPQQVAFKAQASDGFSDDVRGAVFTAKGDTLARFTTLHDGMGVFSLTAPKGEALKAVTISLRDGAKREFTLPVAKEEAIALKVEYNAEGLSYQVLSSKGKVLPGNLRLVVHCRSLLLMDKSLSKDETSGVLEIGNYPDGIAHMVLCTDDGQALSRRLVFIANKAAQDVWSLETDKATYRKRDKMLVEFNVQDVAGKPLRGDFSVSVTDAKIITPDLDADNVVSNLLLTSDLKGYIENPAWYFTALTSEKEKRTQALDLVMMTHGWSRFDTDNLSKKPVYTPEEPLEVGQYISGNVTGISSKEGRNLISAYNPELKEFASDTINADGTFCISGLDIPESIYFGLKLLTQKKKGVKIHIDVPEYPQPTHKEPFFLTAEAVETQAEKNYLSDGMKNFMLPDVQIALKKSTNKYLKSYFVEKRIGQSEIRAMSDPNRVSNALDLFNVLATEYYPGYFFPTTYGSYEEANESCAEMIPKPIWGKPNYLYVNTDLYENSISIETALTRIRVPDIDRIEFVIKRVGSDNTVWLYFAMKEGFAYNKEEPDSRQALVFPHGYAWPAYFYHQVYESPQAQSVPDARTTLYWNPSVQTDADGNGAVMFYTSDSPGNYNLVIEGVTFDGRPCRFEKLLDVIR